MESRVNELKKVRALEKAIYRSNKKEALRNNPVSKKIWK